MTIYDLIPRPAPLWPGLALGIAVGAGGWVLLDSGGPLKSAKVAEMIGLGGPLGREWTIPYAIVAGGFVALLTTATIDFFRVRSLLPDDGEDLSYVEDDGDSSPATAGEKSWRQKALAFCRERLPDRYGFEHLQAEIQSCHRVLTDRLAVRWGRYYLLSFGAILAAFIAGLYFLKLPVKGADPNAGLLLAFRPLLAATAAAGIILTIVAVAARIGAHAITGWKMRLDRMASAEFKTATVSSQEGGRTGEDDSIDGDDADREDRTLDEDELGQSEDDGSEPTTTRTTPVGEHEPLY